MPVFWTIRHPPVDRGGRCVGQSVVPVTLAVDEALERVVRHAPEELRPPAFPDRVYSSDLPRCADLAIRLAELWGLEPDIDRALREVDFGEWEGRHYDDLQANDRARWERWCDDWQRAAPPGGESLADLEARILSWLASADLSPGTVIITHAGVIRALWVLGGMTWPAAMEQPVPTLGWSRHRVAAS